MENSNITAVVVNWLSASNTLHAIQSFRKFYPDMPLIVVDDDSNERDKSEFIIAYASDINAPDLTYDPNTEILKSIDEVKFLQYPPHKHHAKGEGHCIDLAMQNMDTDWMFHFHSDFRFTEGGFIEEMVSCVNDKTCAVGEDKTRHAKFPALTGVLELINVKLGKKYNLSYQPIAYHEDGSFEPLLEADSSTSWTGIAAGGYYTGRLHQLGYEVMNIKNLSQKYGIHLRWRGDQTEWNKYF